MSVFGEYSRYYDLLYRDKDYEGESRFIVETLRRHRPAGSRVLELGCGTGLHARLLADEGYDVEGIDRSDAMLAEAERRREAAPPGIRSRLRFGRGDVRNHRSNRLNDAVLSLFHVVSYQTTDEELKATFSTAAASLGPDGIFFFDYWYAPAVLTERPAVRVKRMESEAVLVTRIAEPELHPNDSCVDVRYTIFVEDKGTGATQKLTESHRMRYLSLSEITLLANQVGLRVVESCEWMTGREPGCGTWSVCSVLSR